LFLLKKEDKGHLSHWMTEGVEKAGGILAIIGAGGMFGEILQRSGVGSDLGNMLTGASLGVDRKSTRLNSSHVKISYAVFCFTKKIAKRYLREGHSPTRSLLRLPGRRRVVY